MDSRREQLLDVGRDFFSKRHYKDVWIDDIAAAAGVSKGLLYHYFPSKRDFYVAAIRAEAEDMRQRTKPRTDLPPEEQLRGSLDVYLDYVEDHEAGYRTLFGGTASDPELVAIIRHYDELQVARLLEALTGGQSPEALRTALHGWIASNRAVVLDWLDRREMGREDLRELMVHALTGFVQAAQQVDPAMEIGPPPPQPKS